MKKWIVFVVAIAAALVPFASAGAQVTETFSEPLPATATGTFTITEERINESYAVTNPIRRSLTDVFVDLQPGQVTVSATITLNRPGRPSYAGEVVLIPRISNGRVRWTVESVTVDGQAASEDVVRMINQLVSTSWRAYFADLVPGRVTEIVITETDLTVTVAPRR